jgi:hypothetical protein
MLSTIKASFAEIQCSRDSRPIIRCVRCLELRPYAYQREETETKYCATCVNRIVSSGNGVIASSKVELKPPKQRTSKEDLPGLRRRLFKIVNRPELLRQENFVALAAKELGRNTAWVNVQLRAMRQSGIVIPTRLERCANFRTWLVDQRQQSYLSTNEFAKKISEETGYSQRHILELLRGEFSAAPPALKPVCDAVVDVLRLQGRSPYAIVEQTLCKYKSTVVRYAIRTLLELNKIQKSKSRGRVFLSIAEEQ